MKSYNLQVVDFDDILDGLFFQDDIGSREQLTEELRMTDWTYGGNAKTLVEIGDFIQFLADCVDNEICQTLTSYEQIDKVLAWCSVLDYVNLEAKR
jgi:hypothetical protein